MTADSANKKISINFPLRSAVFLIHCLYNEICRPKLKNAYKAVLEFIELAKQELKTEITAVIIPEVDIQKVEQLAQEKSLNFRKRPFSQS